MAIGTARSKNRKKAANKGMLKIVLFICLMLLAASVHAQTPVEVIVKPLELNVRQAPGIKAPLLGRYPQGEIVWVTAREDQPDNGGVWVMSASTTSGLSGWVLADYLRFPEGFDLNGLPIVALETPQSAPETPIVETAVTGTTTTIVNFRAGAGTHFAVLGQLPAGTRVTLNGRTPDSLWLRGALDAQEGWVFANLVKVRGDKNTLPVVDTEEAVTTVTPSGETPPGLVSGIGVRTREIYVAGAALGNRRDVFSKVGDSITISPLFLNPIGHGGLHMPNHPYLQPVVDFYMRTTARTHNSFANASLAAANGWTSANLLDPASATPRFCAGMSPLVCEYQHTRPAIALIMIGTNDALRGVNPHTYTANLERIVQISIEMGVIPVLSTLPNSPYALSDIGEFNRIIAGVSEKYQVPLWDYAMVMAGLPNAGLSSDGIHPSFGSKETGIFTENDLKYGYNMRNLSALMVLDVLVREALY